LPIHPLLESLLSFPFLYCSVISFLLYRIADSRPHFPLVPVTRSCRLPSLLAMAPPPSAAVLAADASHFFHLARLIPTTVFAADVGSMPAAAGTIAPVGAPAAAAAAAAKAATRSAAATAAATVAALAAPTAVAAAAAASSAAPAPSTARRRRAGGRAPGSAAAAAVARAAAVAAVAASGGWRA